MKFIDNMKYDSVYSFKTSHNYFFKFSMNNKKRRRPYFTPWFCNKY